MAAYDKYLAAKAAREAAESWNNLPQGPHYMNDKFDISEAHCTAKITRAGQQYQGGQNYWDAPQALVLALVHIIVEDKSIIERAINTLRAKELDALIACEDETKSRMLDIEQAKKEREAQNG